MPIYEYRCEKCGRVFTAIQRIVEDPLTVHEGCGGAVTRLISGGRRPILSRKSESEEDFDFGPEAPGGFGGGLGDDFDAGEDEDLGGFGGPDDFAEGLDGEEDGDEPF